MAFYYGKVIGNPFKHWGRGFGTGEYVYKVPVELYCMKTDSKAKPKPYKKTVFLDVFKTHIDSKGTKNIHDICMGDHTGSCFKTSAIRSGITKVELKIFNKADRDLIVKNKWFVMGGGMQKIQCLRFEPNNGDFSILYTRDLHKEGVGEFFGLDTPTGNNSDEKDKTPEPDSDKEKEQDDSSDSGYDYFKEGLTNENPEPIYTGDMNNPVEKYIYDLVKKGKYQIILTGAPGTGKTYSAKQFIKKQYEAYQGDGEGIPDDKDWFVQFHPSYDYADFVEGLRPVEKKVSDTETEMTYARVDGKFKKFCRWVAEKNKDNCENSRLYYFLIDEINRADLSKVFGELMYCLEDEYRGPIKGRISTQFDLLRTYEERGNSFGPINKDSDVFGKGFFIPENVVIIGTMNDIDRSVEMFDFALRRRFYWKEIGEGVLEKSADYKAYLNAALSGILEDTSWFDVLVERIISLNTYIADANENGLGLNGSYCVGPSYFKDLKDAADLDDSLMNVWDDRLYPLLKEYCRGQEEGSQFLDECRSRLLGKSSNESSENGEENAD